MIYNLIFSSRSTLNAISFMKILTNKHILSFNKHFLITSYVLNTFNDWAKRIKASNNPCPEKYEVY